MRLWRFQKCNFCGKELKNFRDVDKMHGCHGWRMHIDCLKRIEQIRNEKAIIKLRREMAYIRTWTQEFGEISVYA